MPFSPHCLDRSISQKLFQSPGLSKPGRPTLRAGFVLFLLKLNMYVQEYVCILHKYLTLWLHVSVLKNVCSVCVCSVCASGCMHACERERDRAGSVSVGGMTKEDVLHLTFTVDADID